MGILVRVTDLSPDDHLRDYGAGALIRLERAPSEDGTYVEIDTKPIVSAKFSYEIHDPTGTSSSWYRSRYSSADPGATLFSEYSDPWSDAAPTTYANLDDFLLRVGRPLTEREDRLEDELKMSFFRSPASGADEVRLFDGDGSGVLHVHSGIIELTSARFRLNAFADFADPAPGEERVDRPRPPGARGRPDVRGQPARPGRGPRPADGPEPPAALGVRPVQEHVAALLVRPVTALKVSLRGDREIAKLLDSLSGTELVNRTRRATRAGAAVMRTDLRARARSGKYPKTFQQIATRSSTRGGIKTQVGPTSPLHN